MIEEILSRKETYLKIRILKHQELGRNNRASIGVEAMHYAFPF